jgi:hypothetical protein
VVDDGMIIISTGEGVSGTTAVTGAISGTGILQLADGASLVLDGPVAAGPTIAFTGSILAGGVVNIAGATTVAATITGFAFGDSILASAAVAGVSFDADTGALVLQDAGGTPLQTLDLAGSFAGDSFLALPTASGTDIVLAQGTPQSGPPPAPSPGTEGPDDYTWTGSGGAWGDASNWIDNTAGTTAAAVAPGINNIVTISPYLTQIISGAGNAASLAVGGTVELSGSFAATQLTVSGLLLLAGAGASLTVAGTATLGTITRAPISLPVYNAGTVDVTGGGSLQVGALAITTGPEDFGGGTIFVDSLSSMEIGTAGDAASGALSVDAGESVSAFSLDVVGNVVNNGSFVIGHDGALAISGTVSGTGVIQIGAQAAADFIGPSGTGGVVGSGQTLELTGDNTVDVSPGGSFSAVVSGFAPGDVVSLGAPATAATWTGGTLSLSNDGSPVATVALAGDYTGDTFLVTPGPSQSAITLASAGVVPCFAAGTHILTGRGQVRVEALRVGDLVVTAFGRLWPSPHRLPPACAPAGGVASARARRRVRRGRAVAGSTAVAGSRGVRRGCLDTGSLPCEWGERGAGGGRGNNVFPRRTAGARRSDRGRVAVRELP